MSEGDYRQLLQFVRSQAREQGFQSLDVRIMEDLHGSDGPKADLIFYLTHLREEIQLGSDTQYRNTLLRLREHATTESGEDIAGMRVLFVEEDIVRYAVPELDLQPNPEFREIAEMIERLISDILEDREPGRLS